MTILSHLVAPSSSLPPVRSLRTTSEETITSALHNLQAIYCPLRLPATFSHAKSAESSLAQTDSGYVSEDEVAEEDAVSAPDNEQALTALRANEFERSFIVRWLTAFMARADELPFNDEDSRDRTLDEAALILASFSDSLNDEAEEALTRDFIFPTSLSPLASNTIDFRLNDAPLSGTDHTDVGLQSWGASIILSGLLCSSPERFGLDRLPANPSIVELGAGTGLLSLTLAKLLPRLSAPEATLLATDYHPAVLENLCANITTNFPPVSFPSLPVNTMLLDWSAPPASLKSSADRLFAADVVYAPEHAIWLRDCAAHLLKPDGVFWLVVTVRKIGKFEGIPDTAEAAFVAEGCPRNGDGQVLRIQHKEMLEKKRGIGRGDESGYMLFRIGWA